MARKRIKADVVVRDLGHADDSLAEILELDRQIKEAEITMQRRIDEAKAEAASETEPLKQRRKALEGALAAFAEYKKPELFAKRRSIEQAHGIIGFRKSTELTKPRKVTWADVLAKLKELAKSTDPEDFDFADGIRTKEDVAKDIIRNWPTERIAASLCKLEDKDVFYYETKAESLEEA